MHDPLTVAFEIRRPWPQRRRLLGGAHYYPSLVTIWHKDPERNGTDDSCDWRRPRPWYRHPRWHVHHWKVQVHFTQALKRYLFSRCSKCGGRFTWNYAPMSGWSGGGPRWFRSEVGVYHHGCDSGMSKPQ